MRLSIDQRSVPKILLMMRSPLEAQEISSVLERGKFANSIVHFDENVSWKDQLLEQAKDIAPKLVIMDYEVLEAEGNILQKMGHDQRFNNLAVITMCSENSNAEVSAENDLSNCIPRPFVFEKFMQKLSEMGYYLMIVKSPQ